MANSAVRLSRDYRGHSERSSPIRRCSGSNGRNTHAAKVAPAARDVVGLFGRERFPRLNDVCQFVFCIGSKQDVHVVWHDAPRKQFITRSIEMSEGISGNLRNSWILQKTGTCAGVQKALDFRRMQTLPLLLFGRSRRAATFADPGKPLAASKLNRLDRFTRQGVEQAKGHEIRSAIHFPMWKTSAISNAARHVVRPILASRLPGPTDAGGTPAVHLQASTTTDAT